jgi:uncharacterized protein YutE (UPF0331/DUF86 family)
LAALESDLDTQEILLLNLERLVQLSSDAALVLITDRNWLPLPDTMASCFRTLSQRGILRSELGERLAKAVGFRNLVVHQYEKVDLRIVFAIVTNHLNDFREFARIIDQQS